MDYRVVTGRERNDIESLQQVIIKAAWPEFMNHDVYISRYWVTIYRRFPEYQYALLGSDDDRVLAIGNTLPLVWDDEPGDLPDRGLDWALEHCFNHLDSGMEYKVLCAFQIVVATDLLGRGLSYDGVREMIKVGREYGLKKLIAPVRPNQKSKYPLTPMINYINWKNEQGLPFDGWMRVHARLGAATVRVCPESMLIEGTPAEWELWTGIKFPESGEYIVPGALVPVKIDRETNRGTYIEPNLWMVHTLR
ncbi:MAG: hypothetical protein JXA92_03910 [candidate division Zixibacteria bacterium]|nr:hypothetical protein [candidate division Zixibacteria bacterium]